MSADVIAEYLNGSMCSPGPALAEKQAELAGVISKATPGTGPQVLEMAAMANSLSDVRRLREGGAAPLSSSGTLLHTAAMFGSPPMIEYLVAQGFELEDAGEASGPALLAAVQAGNIENVRSLIANGANVNATDTSGAPVIRHAVFCENQAVVDLLLEAGAVPESTATPGGAAARPVVMPKSEDPVALHPDFPVVSGDYQLSTNWTITLARKMNRRMEDQDLVLWRPGLTVWISLWNNDHDESVPERIRWLQSGTSPDAFDVTVRADDTPARYSYRLNEEREEGTVYALYGFALKDLGHLQMAVYVDRESDIADARSLFDSLR